MKEEGYWTEGKERNKKHQILIKKGKKQNQRNKKRWKRGKKGTSKDMKKKERMRLEGKEERTKRMLLVLGLHCIP